VLRPTAKKNATITVRVDEATKTALERFATEDDRKLSAYCARVLKAIQAGDAIGGGRGKEQIIDVIQYIMSDIASHPA
jgi:hypothetical protein